MKILNHFLSLTPFTTNRMKSKLTRSQTHINNLEWRSYCKTFRKKFFGQWTWFGKSNRFWNDPKNPFQLLIFSSFAKSFTPKKIIRKIDFFSYLRAAQFQSKLQKRYISLHKLCKFKTVFFFICETKLFYPFIKFCWWKSRGKKFAKLKTKTNFIVHSSAPILARQHILYRINLVLWFHVQHFL